MTNEDRLYSHKIDENHFWYILLKNVIVFVSIQKNRIPAFVGRFFKKKLGKKL